MCVRLVLRKTKFDSATDCLKSLHWLPIKQWIAYKILVLTYKSLHGEGPQYLQELITPYKPAREGLRSNNMNLLVRPTTKLKTFAARSFKAAAPELWNTLPTKLKSSSSLLNFRNRLKTHLYQQAFC